DLAVVGVDLGHQAKSVLAALIDGVVELGAVLAVDGPVALDLLVGLAHEAELVAAAVARREVGEAVHLLHQARRQGGGLALARGAAVDEVAREAGSRREAARAAGVVVLVAEAVAPLAAVRLAGAG